MLLIRIFKALTIGLYMVLLFMSSEIVDNPTIAFYFGLLIFGIFGVTRFTSYMIFRRESFEIRIINSESNNLIITLILILGIALIVNYIIDIVKLNVALSLFSFFIGLLFILESLNRYRRDIFLNKKLIGQRYLDRFITWDRINSYQIERNAIELKSSNVSIKMQFEEMSSNETEEVINHLNEYLSRVLEGELAYEDSTLKVKNNAA